MTRDLWTRGSFSEIGGSVERKLHFGILMLSLEALLLRNGWAGLRDVQISWQAHVHHDP